LSSNAADGRPRRPPRGGPTSPPVPSLSGLLERLGVGDADLVEQRKALSRAAYGGALRPGELALARQAGLIPFDYEKADRGEQ
jgi:hypothetical protein